MFHCIRYDVIYHPFPINSHDVPDCRLADWQVNDVNNAVKCFNRFPIPKLDFQKTKLILNI